MQTLRFSSLLFVILIVAPATAGAAVTIYTNKAQWQAAAGANTKIDFLGHPAFTVITDQYAEQGVTFIDGNDFIQLTQSYPADGAGLVSASDVLVPASGVHMLFDQPRNAIGVDYIGYVKLQFFLQDQMVYESNAFSTLFQFAGFTSRTPFDKVLVWDSVNAVVSIDNLHFGAPVPGPAAAVIIIAGLAAVQGRRRHA